ncbi:hypothetical protein ACOMHN_013716 [Nucella lapillus]
MNKLQAAHRLKQCVNLPIFPEHGHTAVPPPVLKLHRNGGTCMHTQLSPRTRETAHGERSNDGTGDCDQEMDTTRDATPQGTSNGRQ